jgi:hypothetical protein
MGRTNKRTMTLRRMRMTTWHGYEYVQLIWGSKMPYALCVCVTVLPAIELRSCFSALVALTRAHISLLRPHIGALISCHDDTIISYGGCHPDYDYDIARGFACSVAVTTNNVYVAGGRSTERWFLQCVLGSGRV